jgi:segregation and condensation protein B
MRRTDDSGGLRRYNHVGMDDISRDGPLDTTTPTGSTDGRRSSERGRGPEELLRFERAQFADLVVRDADAGDRAGGGLLAPDRSVHADAIVNDPSERTEPEATAVDAGDVVDAASAAAAIAAEADTAMLEAAAIDDDLADVDDEGLPAVPELADADAVAQVVFVLMLTSREGLTVLRLAQACNTSQKLVEEALQLLPQKLAAAGLPAELTRTGDTVKWMSKSDSFPYLQRLRGVKKMEKLSPAALETLAVIAYRQPVMRGEIEAVRGVKAGPMLRTLLQHKLVRCTGRAEVPGRPLQYGTTQQFLERFGLASLQDLPSVKEWKNLG